MGEDRDRERKGIDDYPASAHRAVRPMKVVFDRDWKAIFKDWDAGLANEMFPAHDAAILLDPVGAFEDVAVNDPETLLEFSDFMKIGIEPAPVALDRFKGLPVDELRREPR